MATMDDRLVDRLRTAEVAYDETLEQLSEPDVLSDQNRYREITTRHAELKPIIEAYRRYVAADIEVTEATELAAIEDDPEMKAYLADTIDEPRALFRLVLADADVSTWRMPIVDRGEDPLAVWSKQYYHR